MLPKIMVLVAVLLSAAVFSHGPALEGFTCSVVIADNGIGIPPENLTQVFEPFFSTKPATGTGLGLGMVKKMVSLYNGKIEFAARSAKEPALASLFRSCSKRKTL